MIKKRPLILGLSAAVLAAGIIAPVIIFSSRAGDNETSQIEVEDDVRLVSNLFTLKNTRAKVSSLAPTSETYSSSEKGLLIFGYDVGGEASYKQLLSGTNTFRSIANTKNKKTPNLLHYSYRITDVKSGESFKIHVLTGEKVTNYYVECDGKIAGESYFSSINGLVTHGYTKLYNNSGTYTQVTSTGANIDSKITFNPADMSIVVEGQTKSFEVWNFQEEYIDGKGQIKFLNSFENYTVDIVFEELIANSKAELVLYQIGNKKFDGAILNNSLTLTADLSLKGVVNQAYTLPTPVGETKENTEVWVYKEDSAGDPVEVMHGKLNVSNTFTPTSAGDYYILYKTAEGELRDKVTVISNEVTTHSFENGILDLDNYGYKSIITVPHLTYSSNRSSETLKSLVTIKLGEQVLVKDRAPGFEFVFDHHPLTTTGNTDYTFIYKCENDNITETVEKTVTVKSSNGVHYFAPYLSDYSTGSTIQIAKGYYYKDGQEYVCNADVIYPASQKVVSHSSSDFGTSLPTLKLDSSGLFTIKYHNVSVGADFEGKFRAMPKTDELFTCVDASTSFGNSSSSDINHGVIGSFKNDGTITYNKVIDANTLTKDKKLISLSAQSKIPGTSEMNHIYITVEDASDPDNYFEIRMSQGSDNVNDKTFIRALANGQSYGGFYYNSWFDVETTVVVDRWLSGLTFGATETKTFNNFTCEASTTGEGADRKMSIKIDHNPKNLHFLQENITSSSFTNDLQDLIGEFDDEISSRLGNGRLTKADVGTSHEPEITWQADNAHDQGGFLHEHSFTAAMDTYSFEGTDYADFYYDNEEKAVYTNFYYHVAGYQPESRIVKLCEFDDPSTFGGDKVWDGFKTNEVKITVRATGITDNTGDVFIREICGNKFDGELLGDDDNPILDIDDSVIPYAKVGTSFKPLDAICKDATSAVESLQISIKDPDDENVVLVNGKFTPTKSGIYTLTYTAFDSFGNETTKVSQIEAKPEASFQPFDTALSVTDGDVVQYGINYQIPNPTISGGCGKYSIKKEVSVDKGSGDVEELEVIDGKVKVLHTGTYTVKITSTDYLGETCTDTYTFSSTFSSDPIYEGQMVLPERLFKGVPYQLDKATVELFEQEGEEQKIVNVKARVTDSAGTRVLGEDMIYTPECAVGNTTAHIELFVTAGGGDIVVDQTDVEVFDISNSNYVTEGYFINSGTVTTEALFGCITFKSNVAEGDIDTRFVYPINDDALSLIFRQYYISGRNKQCKSNLDTFKVTLTDFYDQDVAFDILYTQTGTGLMTTLPGNMETPFKNSNSFTDLDHTGDIGFSFNHETNSIVDVTGINVGKITKCSNGDAFTGFPSGKALISIQATGVDLDNGFYLNKISNNTLNNSKVDNIAPAMTINGSYGGYVQEGEKVTLPTATAYDVLSYCGTPTLTIKSEETGEFAKDINGVTINQVPTNKEYIVKFEKYGKYDVLYEAKDSANNKVTVNAYSYYVTDAEPATLTFTGELTSDTYNTALFSSINLTNFTVVDNAGSNGCMVSIYVVDPNSEMITIKTDKFDYELNKIVSSFTENSTNGVYQFNGKGRYQIIYLVTDSNGNVSAVTKNVIVK